MQAKKKAKQSAKEKETPMETDDNVATEENTDHAQMSVASRGFHPEGLYSDLNCPKLFCAYICTNCFLRRSSRILHLYMFN